MIGTDSYLRKTSVDNLSNITLAPAERVDILINIDAKLATIKPTDIIKVISKKVKTMNREYFGQTLLAVFNITSSKGSMKMNLTNIRLNVAWTDFRTIPDSSIYVRRMRPLFFTSDH